jgi:hypothetical protein
VDKSVMLTLLFSKIISSTFAVFTSIIDVRDLTVLSLSWMSLQQFFNYLHHFLECCIVVMPSANTPFSCQWILVGKHFVHGKWIRLHSSLWDQVAKVAAIAHEYRLTVSCATVASTTSGKWNVWLTQELQSRELY